MDTDEDLGLDKLFSEEVLGIIMTEPIDPALYDINVEAELATLSTEQRKEEELDEPTELHNLLYLTQSERSFLQAVPLPPSKCVDLHLSKKNEMEKLKESAIPNSTTSDTKYCFKLWNDWCEYRLKCHGDVIPLLSDLKSKELS